ncbi:MAG TPA: GlsB/YeaQ/YmgE family stress response membrane protein [Pirellulales bacterium]|jgi:uncharacterized membrane protein YeaQ/YmgE (transglycosylase-associated protein family)|nr:GlsB/YeaQ/YmgE family stress response membrane protein [Pirellulales bacterium]
MDQAELFKTMHEVANDILLWIGFGTLAGLLAKAIMPGRDPGGAVATLLMGIGGSVIGSGVLTYFWEGHRVTPISPEGFVVATAGAFVLLFFYRFFRRDQYIEGESPRKPFYARGGARGRGKREVIIEE